MSATFMEPYFFQFQGLCSPLGTVLVGDAEHVKKARNIRKTLGGGMRQAGIVAAAGLYSMKTIAPQLKDDHRRAHQLAQGTFAR